MPSSVNFNRNTLFCYNNLIQQFERRTLIFLPFAVYKNLPDSNAGMLRMFLSVIGQGVQQMGERDGQRA